MTYHDFTTICSLSTDCSEARGDAQAISFHFPIRLMLYSPPRVTRNGHWAPSIEADLIDVHCPKDSLGDASYNLTEIKASEPRIESTHQVWNPHVPHVDRGLYGQSSPRQGPRLSCRGGVLDARALGIVGWYHNGTIPEELCMPTLTIKGIPEVLYRRLRQRAEAHRRSLNREIIVALEQATNLPTIDPETWLAEADQLRARLDLPALTEARLRSRKAAGRP